MYARRMLCSVGLVFLTAGTVFGQCQQTLGLPSFNIIGRVINEADNSDVSFATLRLDGSSGQKMVVSNAQGGFVFTCVPAGSYTIEATRHGFHPATERVDLINAGEDSVRIYMRPIEKTGPQPEGNTLSAREAQIPDKARKQFESGKKKLYDQNNAEGSIKDFEEAIKLFPDYDDAYVQLGYAYGRLARFNEAEKTFRKAIEVYDQNGPAHAFLGKLLSERGRVEEAIPELQRAIAIDDTNWLAHLDLARILAKKGNKTEAYAHAKRAHELRTTVQDVHLAYYNACVSLGNYAEALAELDELVKLYPKSETAKKLLAIRPKLAAEPAAKTP